MLVHPLQWAAKSASSNVLMETSFRTYASDNGMIVFEQKFPSTLSAADLGTPALSAPSSGTSSQTVFPGFRRNTGPADGLACFSYHGVFPAMTATTVAKYAQSHQGGTPLAIYDAADPALPMLVFSPLNFPKAHHMASGDAFFGAGVKDTVTEIPAGWSQLFLLSAATGINDGMMAWGNRMLQFTGKPRADPYRDLTHSSIGFWTDK